MKTIRKIGSIIVLLTLTVSAVQAQESLSVFPVTDYGATGNGGFIDGVRFKDVYL